VFGIKQNAIGSLLHAKASPDQRTMCIGPTKLKVR